MTNGPRNERHGDFQRRAVMLPWRGGWVTIDAEGRWVPQRWFSIDAKGRWVPGEPLGRGEVRSLAEALPALAAAAQEARDEADRLPEGSRPGTRAGFTHRPVPEDRDQVIADLYRRAQAKQATPYADWIAERLPEGDPLHAVPPLRDWQRAAIRKAVQRARAAKPLLQPDEREAPPACALAGCSDPVRTTPDGGWAARASAAEMTGWGHWCEGHRRWQDRAGAIGAVARVTPRVTEGEDDGR